jgi:hypothetical protein
MPRGTEPRERGMQASATALQPLIDMQMRREWLQRAMRRLKSRVRPFARDVKRAVPDPI